APANESRRRAFTLFEIVVAVAILGMMSLAIYRFVQTNVTALRLSSDENQADAQYSGLENLLTNEWQSLAPGSGALLGEPLKTNDSSKDEITWICSAGPGLLTRYAEGEYRVSLRLRPMTKSKDGLELGVVRTPADTPEKGENDHWVPLVANVRTLELRYFDPRLNTWVDKWTDTVTLPRLVKVSIGRENNSIPWQSIIALGRTPW
ncbi:MAG: type II secretion system GspH family protein, partial [Verrucomicrobiota bacterium]|nr:type II secretion system GspH family protein [Verrucomicrobiota bacterium]